MQLSVIIVNYNVKHFLEQCLYSVRKAAWGILHEVIVVDNNSSDGSLQYLKPRFPEVKFIACEENYGFAKACNKGRSLASGEYILFLNPDTILAEDCLKKCLSFLDLHPDAGALGVKMLDGKGRFLKESKRAFPSPVTSLYKLFGLAKLFPSSRMFSAYHLGHLNEGSTHEVDVLAGAFMFVKKEVLEKVGGFDEVFFMYGEDVDLSYRIQNNGYKNYYFADTCILHFKGESTRKGTMNYVRMFYNAMSIFVRKHYGGSKASIFNFFIHVAIWIRAAMSAIAGFIRKIGLPLIDAVVILLSFWLVKNFWNEYIKTDTEYPNRLLWIAFPSFTLVYLLVAYYAGLYDRRYKRQELVRSTLIATIVLLAGYALLPEHFRFSRAIILFGALLAFVLISVVRWLLIRSGVLSSSKQKTQHAETLIVGSLAEFAITKELMNEAGLQERILGRVAIDEADKSAIGSVDDLPKLSRSIPFREIIFCEGNLSFSTIMEKMQQLPNHTSIKFHASGSGSIVGSDSKHSSGEAVSKENGFNLSDQYNRRLKRLLDVLFSLFSLISFPVHLIAIRKPFNFFANCFKILLAQKTWIGYASGGKNLPPLRAAVIGSNGWPVSAKTDIPAESLQMLDYWYARDYEAVNDLKLLWKTYRWLGG